MRVLKVCPVSLALDIFEDVNNRLEAGLGSRSRVILAPWSRSRLKVKTRSRSRLEKKSGAGADKKFAGSPALARRPSILHDQILAIRQTAHINYIG